MAEFLPPKPYHLQPGSVIERFEILGVVGQGGFALTYLAVDKQLEREVIIKEYFPTGLAQRDPDGQTVVPTDDENFTTGLESFYREALSLSQLQHRNIVSVISVVRDNDTAYMVMPYYAGTDLETYLQQRGGPLGEAEAYALLKPVLEALDYIHHESVIHRDVKPANIFLAQRSSHHYPILLDFGGARQFIADVTQDYTQLLSLGYAPFEQYFRDGKQGPWTDIYAAAAVLFRMITGERPLDATERKAGKPLDLSGLSPGFAGVLEKALAESYQARHQTMAEFIAACESALTGPAPVSPGPVPPSPAPSHPEPIKKRGGLKAALVTLSVLLTLGLGAGAVWWQFFRTRTYIADTAAKLERYVMEARKGSIIEVQGDLLILRSLEVDRQLSIKGEGAETTSLQIQGPFPLILLLTDETLNLSGLTLERTGTEVGNIVEVDRGNLVVTDSVVKGAISSQNVDPPVGGRGIMVKESAQSVTLTGSRVEGNDYAGIEVTGGGQLSLETTVVQGNGVGLMLAGNSQTNINQGDIIQNESSGIEVSDAARLVLTQMRIQNNPAGGIFLANQSRVEATNTLFHQNLTGLIVEGESSLILENSILSENEQLGVYLREASTATIQGSTIQNNLIGIVADATTTLNQTNNQFSGNQEGDVQGP